MANRNKSPLKILEKMERGRIQRLSIFWGRTPYYLGNEQSYGLQIWRVHLQGQSE